MDPQTLFCGCAVVSDETGEEDGETAALSEHPSVSPSLAHHCCRPQTRANKGYNSCTIDKNHQI
ncbi:hypothetical protein DPEC_G00232120 [Dallia pectoralis]|uniref:Uncharacterized protein n=1 Tax=Dallia pectoralis TaxID=75939 RepID=A0ACC2FXK8_DALPE|nr:hypothetical protein DPEC_G00232120 [Dallia pectoralis]